MDREVEISTVAAMLRKLLGAGGLESAGGELGLRVPGFEQNPEVAYALDGLTKVSAGRDLEVTAEELRGLEAIILPRLRPVALIRGGAFDKLPEPWEHLDDAAIRSRLHPLFASIGRIELPGSPNYPYGGTGFVVGEDLVMTNRHVAKLFTDGIGAGGLRYRAGEAAIDFDAELGTSAARVLLAVREVVMIHPYWDMALLRVDNLPAERPALRLAVRHTEDLGEREVVAVGYPARDVRGQLALQDRIFIQQYQVKRFQPGMLRGTAAVNSFGRKVHALTHDCSTLGGNSGSAVLDIETGEVLGLHFAGLQFEANYAAPMHALASDQRVVDLGLNFIGSAPPDPRVEAAWRALSEERPRVPARPRAVPRPAPGPAPTAAIGESITLTIPIQITLSIGQPTPGTAARVNVMPASDGGYAADPAIEPDEAPRFQVPIVYPRLGARRGYQPGFLEFDDDGSVPLPLLTAAGKRAAAPLADGSTELKYHKFSIVMHKVRRLALFTAANVDWRAERRRVDGQKPTRAELTGITGRTAEAWLLDPRISENHQLPDIFFTDDGQAFDKGHLVRRDDVCWGHSFEDIQKANGDTYHTTNCSPQVSGFNRSGAIDNWGDLEKLIQRETAAERVCLFSGPVLASDDPVFQGRSDDGALAVQIPQKFWKIVVARGDDGPQVFGFVLEQDLEDIDMGEEFVVPRTWRRYMHSIADIEALLSGLVKLTWLARHDQYEGRGRRIAARAGIRRR